MAVVLRLAGRVDAHGGSEGLVICLDLDLARDPIAAGEDIIAISGATISSRAMAVGVRRAVGATRGFARAPRPA